LFDAAHPQIDEMNDQRDFIGCRIALSGMIET
jgi:hypothetical protein